MMVKSRPEKIACGGRGATYAAEIRRYICHESGHLIKDCAKGDRKANTEKKSVPITSSARLRWTCLFVGTEQVSKNVRFSEKTDPHCSGFWKGTGRPDGHVV